VFRTVARGLVALVLSAGTLIWAFHDVDLGDLRVRLVESEPTAVILFLVLQALTMVVRIVRWGVLVRPLGNPSSRAIFTSGTLGLSAAVFLPLRLGEFVRPVLISRSGVSFGGAMGAVVLERIVDGLVNLVLFFVLSYSFPPTVVLPPTVSFFANIACVVFGGATTLLMLAVYSRRLAVKLVHMTLGRISENIALRVANLLSSFLDGVSAMAHPGRLVAFLGLTAAYWGLNGYATWFLAESYVPDLGWMAGLFVVATTVFAVMIPAGPAFAGTLEAGYRFGLMPFGVSASQAAVVAVASHILQLFGLVVFTGLGLLVQAGPVSEVAPLSKVEHGSE
jgi:glycosyltransferase 2 family protein